MTAVEKSLDDISSIDSEEIDDKDKGQGKTIEETYKKTTQREHILLRPDTYVGSLEPITQSMFVLDKEQGAICRREITFTPALYKIFDEIVVNAADNKQRDPNMSEVRIVVDADANIISVQNDGTGLPIEHHKEHSCYVPSLVFGELLTGSNFDDTEAKTTGGRNGYGAKLANIYSLWFKVECLDASRELKFTQLFRDNMSVKEPPIVVQCTAAEAKKGDYTKISFSPDLKRFNMTALDKDTVSLLSKRAYDIAGSMAARHGKKLSVYLNSERLAIKSFQDYIDRLDGINPLVAYEKVGKRWEVGVTYSQGNVMEHVSFVNAICTSKGGSHVDYIADQVASHLVRAVNKKTKGGTGVKPQQIKNHLCVFVNCLVENPVFDGQTKENLTSRPKSFGSVCKLSEKFLKQVAKSEIVENVISDAEYKQRQALKRKSGAKKIKLTGIPKLDDANKAGSARSLDCTLIVTEGDSAKTLAMSGLSVVGRDFYGVFPLRGKLMNCRDAPHSAVMKNEEIKNIVHIMGLKYDTEYDERNIKTLRYGCLMIMADQDHDGSHIKGLVINLIHKFWPSLLNVDGFLKFFITPIVKAQKRNFSRSFFTTPEVEQFKAEHPESGWSYKYYKGLGTSTAEEAKEYFSNLDQHVYKFGILDKDTLSPLVGCSETESDEDVSADGDIVPEKVSSGSDLIDMAFRKNRVEDRKTWLNKIDDDVFLDYRAAQAQGSVRYSSFVNRELIQFSKADNKRSIPNFVDGFKPSQRKILFACFKKNLKKEMKVAQLAGYVGEHAAFHHGEASLHGTITGMAQNYCGSNNLNLLLPSGQFGTRRMGGKDAASPRYIFTALEPYTRAVFHEDDDPLLDYLEDDGLSIEPKYYVPVIPLVLVNGADGIGTGWSSNVPNYCPRDIIANLRLRINGEEAPKLHPKYYGFTGPIKATGTNNSYAVEGKIERVDESTLTITELPLKKWTQDYKMFLEGLLTGDGKKQDAEIKDFTEDHTDTTVSFTISADPAKIDEFEKAKGGLLGKFKLCTSLSTSNMNLFDRNGRITKFADAEGIMSAFFGIRMEYYHKRKAFLVSKLSLEKMVLANKARFINELCRGDLVASNRKRTDLLTDLKTRGYDLFPKDLKSGTTHEQVETGGDEGAEEDTPKDDTVTTELAKGYEYLLGMKIWSLTFEKAARLGSELEAKTKELCELQATKPSQIWLKDLDALESALDERDKRMELAAEKERQARDTAQLRGTGKGKKKAVSRKSKKKTILPRAPCQVEDSPPRANKKQKVSPESSKIDGLEQ